MAKNVLPKITSKSEKIWQNRDDWQLWFQHRILLADDVSSHYFEAAMGSSQPNEITGD